MNKYDLSHVSDADLMRDLPELVKREREHKAELLIDLAEVLRRGLKLPPDRARDMKLFLDDLIESSDRIDWFRNLFPKRNGQACFKAS